MPTQKLKINDRVKIVSTQPESFIWDEENKIVRPTNVGDVVTVHQFDFATNSLEYVFIEPVNPPKTHHQMLCVDQVRDVTGITFSNGENVRVVNNNTRGKIWDAQTGCHRGTVAGDVVCVSWCVEIDGEMALVYKTACPVAPIHQYLLTADVELFTATPAPAKLLTCTCTMHVLMVTGCRCGYLKAQRKASC